MRFVYAEYLRMKKNPSMMRACRVTTQKLLYFLVFLACLLRGAYFAAPVSVTHVERCKNESDLNAIRAKKVGSCVAQ